MPKYAKFLFNACFLDKKSSFSFRYNKQLIAQLVGRHEDLFNPENSCLPRASPSGDIRPRATWIFWVEQIFMSPSKLGNRNVRHDVTAWICWQRSHHCYPLLTRQKRCFYKGQSLTWAHIFVVRSNIKNLPGYFKRWNISLPDDISQTKIHWRIKEKL